jgi:hypothetical protein
MHSVLEPAYPNLEYMVLDGGSTDESARVLARYSKRLAFSRQERDAGPYSAVNEGLARAGGEIFAWLNSGDTYHPWTLRVVAEVFTLFPQIEWLTGVPTKVQDGAVHAVAPLRPYPRKLLRLGLFAGGEFGLVQQESCFWRRSLWESAGGLLEARYSLAADFELWTRFARRAELYCCSTVLAGFTIGGDNRSLVHKDRYAEEVDMVVNSLSPVEHRERESLLRSIRVYRACRPYTGLKGLSKRLSGLSRELGPVIRRDFASHGYQLERLPFFC